MKRLVLIGSLILCPAPVLAESWFVATVSSYHSKCPSCYNHHNSGLGGEFSVAKNARIVTGFYDNSQEHTSIYGGLSYTPLRWDNIRVGATFGLVTGYREEDRGRASFMAVPLIEIENNGFGVNLGFVPTKHAGLVIGLQLKFRFKE